MFDTRDIDFTAHIERIQSELTTSEQRERLEEAMKVYKGEDKIVSSLELAERMKQNDPLPDWPTGIVELDHLLGGGFRPKQLVTFAAPPKSGKTTWCIELTSSMKKYNPLWFPIEESAEELIEKFQERGEEPPLFYFPDTMKDHRNTKWIEERIVEAKVKFDTKIVFIDHLGRLVPHENRDYHRQVTFTVEDLKSIAKRWDVCIIVISHINKPMKIDEVPIWTDIAESAGPGRESDVVLMMWRRATRTKEAGMIATNDIIVSVDLIRRGNGKTGKVKMTYRNGHYFSNDWEESFAEFESPNKNYGKF